MGLFDRLRAWWRRRFGAGDAGAPQATDYECAVCGTGVEDPNEECPLCRSTDVVPAGSRSAGPVGGSSAPGARRRVETADEAAVDRLRELCEDGELLQRYGDRWEPVEGGFRVETANGTREVDSREEVAALLRAEEG